MRKIALLFVIMIGLANLVISAEAPKQITLEQAKSDYQKLQLSAAEKYSKILTTEEGKATEAGNLDLVTEIQAEKEAISGAETNTTNKEWKKSKTLAIAAKNFNGDLGKTKKSYVASLEKVIMELTKQKKINEAKEVKTILEDIKVEEIKKIVVGKWNQDGKWVWNFTSDFKVEAGDHKGTWKFQDNKILVSRGPLGQKLFLDGNEWFIIVNNSTLKRTFDNVILKKF